MPITGTVQVTAQIAPSALTDTYASHDSQYGLGGHHEATDHTARNAIPAERRREGMTCYTANDEKTWQLQGGILDANWADISGGGGGVPTSRTITTTAPLTIDGGGSADLSANRTLAISSASTISPGAVQLTDTYTGSSEVLAVTQKGVKDGLATKLGTSAQAADSAKLEGHSASYFQTAYTILETLGGLANASGWLHNDGAGVLSYSTPTSVYATRAHARMVSRRGRA